MNCSATKYSRASNSAHMHRLVLNITVTGPSGCCCTLKDALTTRMIASTTSQVGNRCAASGLWRIACQ
ncbi:hypothetical protein D3C78_1963430 [compost metagenome]